MEKRMETMMREATEDYITYSGSHYYDFVERHDLYNLSRDVGIVASTALIGILAFCGLWIAISLIIRILKFFRAKLDDGPDRVTSLLLCDLTGTIFCLMTPIFILVGLLRNKIGLIIFGLIFTLAQMVVDIVSLKSLANRPPSATTHIISATRWFHGLLGIPIAVSTIVFTIKFYRQM
jgi:hypothetical protein